MGRARRPMRAALGALLALGVGVLGPLVGEAGGEATRRWVVVIDAGHGGRDPGALGVSGVQEKHVTLAIARLVEIFALDDPRLAIVLTRRQDVTLSLKERIAIAERVDADLYISVHANAHTTPGARGVETLVPASKARSDPRTLRLARALQAQLASQLGALGVPDRGVKAQRLYLRWARVPAALVEVGFLTNPGEGRRLQELWYQARIARALLEGVRAFLGL